MRITHVVESLDLGGLEQVVVALSAAQAGQGHAVRIVCLWRTGALAARAEAAGVAVECAHKRDGPDAAALLRLRRLLRQHPPDVLHTHNPMAHYHAVAATLGCRPPRLLNTRHGMGSADAGARRERLYRLAMARTDLAVCVCRAARDRFVADGVIPAAKACVVPNGTALDRFEAPSAMARSQARAALGLPADAVVFGSVGRLNEAKQQHLLLQALRRLHDRGLPAMLLLVGDGPLRASLAQQAHDLALTPHVHLPGSRDDVPALLAAMDVFVLPSRTEGWSLALVEASAAGLPCIATRVGGNGEIVQHGVSGLLVPPGDRAGASQPDALAGALADALAEAMAALAGDPARRTAFGQAGREWAWREASLATMRDRYGALYGRAQPVTEGAVPAAPASTGGRR